MRTRSACSLLLRALPSEVLLVLKKWGCRVIVILREHWQHRRQILELAKTDLAKTYRGAALGWSWAVIKPAATIIVLYLALTFGLRANGTIASGTPYYVWLTVGMIPWFYMSDMLTAGGDSIRSYPYLITKMRFPVSTITTFVGLSKLYVHLFLLVMLFAIYFLEGGTLDWYLVQLPLYVLLMFAFSTSWALLAAPLSALSKDFSSLVKSVTTPIFWLSGIIWDPETVQNTALKVFLNLNPFTFIARGYRDVFVYKQWIWEHPQWVGGFLAVFTIQVALAVRTHQRLRKELPDVL